MLLLVLLVLLVVGGVGDGWWLSLQDSGGAHAAASSSMANAGEHGKVWREVEIVYVCTPLAGACRQELGEVPDTAARGMHAQEAGFMFTLIIIKSKD